MRSTLTPPSAPTLPNPRLFPFAAVLASLLGLSACDTAFDEGPDESAVASDAHGGDALGADAGARVRWAPPGGPVAHAPSPSEATDRVAPSKGSRLSASAPSRHAAPAAALLHEREVPVAAPARLGPGVLLGLTAPLLGRARQAIVAAATRSPLASWAARHDLPRGWVGTVFGDMVVLPFIPEARWTSGPARLVDASDGAYRFTRDLDAAALPVGVRAVVGQRLRLIEVDGGTCEAVISGLTVESRFFDRTAMFWGDEEMGVRRSEQTPEQGWSDGQPFLLGTLTPVAGDCRGAIFAQLATAPAPRTFKPVTAARAEVRAAVAAFRALPAWRTEQASFSAEVRDLDRAARRELGLRGGGVPRWDTAYGEAPRVQAFEGRGGERVVIVRADADAGCGGPFASLSAVFRVEGAGRGARFVPFNVESWGPALEGLVDLDGDGRPEGVRASDDVPSLWELRPRESGLLQFLAVPDHSVPTCPC